jgi:hypothetical protein
MVFLPIFFSLLASLISQGFAAFCFLSHAAGDLSSRQRDLLFRSIDGL